MRRRTCSGPVTRDWPCPEEDMVGLHEGGVSDLVESGGQLGLAACESECGGAHAGEGGGEGADALAVHRGLDGEGVGDDAHASLLTSG